MSRALRRHPPIVTGPRRPQERPALPRPQPRPPGRPPRRRGPLGFLYPGWVQDIAAELRKVVWPSRKETTSLTVVVVIVSIVVGAILGGIDIAFSRIMDRLLF